MSRQNPRPQDTYVGPVLCGLLAAISGSLVITWLAGDNWFAMLGWTGLGFIIGLSIFFGGRWSLRRYQGRQ